MIKALSTERSSGSARGASGSSGSRRSRDDGQLDSAVCTFWIGGHTFGIAIHLVGEVVSVSDIAEIPLAPPAILGLFNLRGVPVPVVDLSAALATERRRDVATYPALVLRIGEMVVALAIERMEAVVQPGRVAIIPARSDENPLVQGFVEVPGAPIAVTLISPTALAAHLERLKFSHTEDLKS